MSLKLNERYPGRFNNPSAGYPGGSFKNRTTPTAKDGSYLEKDWANDKEGFFQSLLSAAGITANGAVDAVGASQFFDALQALKQIQAGTAFTTAGSAGALKLAPTPAISAYSAPLRLRVKFSQASTGADTINVSGLGAKSLKQYDSTGAKVAAVFAVNQLADVEYDGTDMVVLDPLPSGAVQATESAAGFAKVATQALTNAGVDDATIVTPKKLFAAQQTALNLKMNLTGGGAVPRFGAVSVNANGMNTDQQGAYLLWNETGWEGRTSLVNNQGGGAGGFIFRNINKDNTAETGRVTIDAGGSLSSTGSITANGNVQAGPAALQSDGNINGSVWGGGLYTYITNYVNANVPLVCAAQGASGVGTYALLYIPSQTQGPGWLASGNYLYWASAAGNTGGGIVGVGTWRLMGYINASNTSLSTSLYLRIS